MTQQENEHTYTEQIAHPQEPQPRYYLRTGDSEHTSVDLIERGAIDNGDGPEDMTLASFYDGDCKESKLAEFVRDALNVGDALARHGNYPGVLSGIPISGQGSQLTYTPSLAEQIGLSGALFAFMGWLTTRTQESGPFSGHNLAGPAATLIKQFCTMQGWPIPPDGWDNNIKPYVEPEEPPAFYTPLSAESELARGMWPMQKGDGVRQDAALEQSWTFSSGATITFGNEDPPELYVGSVSPPPLTEAYDSPYGNFPKTAEGEGYLAKALREEGEKLLENAKRMEPYVSYRKPGESTPIILGRELGRAFLEGYDCRSRGMGFEEEEDDEEEFEEDDEDEEIDEAGEPPPIVVPVRLDQRTCDHNFEVVPPDAFTVYRCEQCGLGYLDIKHPASFMGFGEHPGPTQEEIAKEGDPAFSLEEYIKHPLREALRNLPASLLSQPSVDITGPNGEELRITRNVGLPPTGPLPWDAALREDERKG